MCGEEVRRRLGKDVANRDVAAMAPREASVALREKILLLETIVPRQKRESQRINSDTKIVVEIDDVCQQGVEKVTFAVQRVIRSPCEESPIYILPKSYQPQHEEVQAAVLEIVSPKKNASPMKTMTRAPPKRSLRSGC